jgi:hypothetical protein
VLIVLAAAVAIYLVANRAKPFLTGSGCQAGTGKAAVTLDPDQAAIAATIAGVAHRRAMPPRAVAVAYAAALQESHLHNLGYGDRDSVGVFQQRPSEGWGPASKLRNPIYASGKFFGALATVPDYLHAPVYKAAQAVQHSADGSAYQQYAQAGAQLAVYFTAAPHAVTCWYDPATQAASQGVSTRLNLNGAIRGLTDAFGPPGASGAVQTVTTARSAESQLLKVTTGSGWAVANWLVANASSYGITRVRYGGYQWTASLTETTWQTSPGGTAGGIVAS